MCIRDRYSSRFYPSDYFHAVYDHDVPSECQILSLIHISAEGTNVGKFETTGVDGKTYTQDIFSKYDLTMVCLIYTSRCV